MSIMRAVIVLTFFIVLQIINAASCGDLSSLVAQGNPTVNQLAGAAQNLPLEIQRFLGLPPCFPPPVPCPAPPVLCPPPPTQPPTSPPCGRPTGSLAILLDSLSNHMNLPNGSLSNLPLCCQKAPVISLPPRVPTTPPPGQCLPFDNRTPIQLLALAGLLSTPQPLIHTAHSFFPVPPLLPTNRPFLPPNLILPNHCAPHQCITNHLEPVVQPFVEECVSNVPILRKVIHNQEEHCIRRIPILEKSVTQREEKFVRHIPIVCKRIRNVVETITRHIPVIKKRIRTVVEPYTSHIAVLEKFCRPVEEPYITNVPVVESCCRPVVTQVIRQVPITERRITPIVKTQIDNVPVKRRILKHFIERRVKHVVGPCNQCCLPHQPCYITSHWHPCLNPDCCCQRQFPTTR